MRPRHLLPSAAIPRGVLFLFSFWLLGPLPAGGQQTVTLVGRVRTDRGQAISSGVNLRLETTEGLLVAQQPASSDGEFEFASLRKMSYRLTVTAEGFQPHQQDLDLGYGATKVVINVFLSSAAKSKPLAGALPALTDSGASKKARKEHEKGLQALGSKKLSEARDHFQRAVAEYSCYARAQTNLALVLSALHELPAAEAALKKAIECDGGFLDAYPQLGLLFNLEKKFAESEAVLQEGLRRSPGSWQFYYQLGGAHFGLGQYTKAEEDYLKAQSFNQTLPAEVHVKLADVYLKTGAYNKAYAEMQAYLRADPNGRFAAKIKNIMQEMESTGVLHSPQAATAHPPASNP